MMFSFIQIVVSAHYMISDSLIPLKTDPACPKLEDVYENIFDGRFRGDVSFGSSEADDEVGVDVKTLCLSKKRSYSTDPSNNGMLLL